MGAEVGRPLCGKEVLALAAFRYYRVNAEFYFNRLLASGPPRFARNVGKVQEAMKLLVDRYNTYSKTVLSVGSGLGHEEYWFYRSGCALTMVDIDEHRSIEPYLEQLPQDSREAALSFYIGDAAEVCPSLPSLRFEVCYFSSFTPDELRRERIIAEYLARGPDARYPSWPEQAEPFHHLVLAILQSLLAPSGLFLCQSYCGGPDLIANPHFVEQSRRQLRTVGVELVEAYCLEGAPGVKLLVGYKGAEHDAREFARQLAARPPLQTFSGRSEVHPCEAVRVYALAGDSGDRRSRKFGLRWKKGS